MATKIRLARGGAKKRPFYRIVVANSTAPRDGDFLEKVGTYDPLLANDHKDRVVLKVDRIEYWLSCGAKPTERVAKFIAEAGVNLPAWAKKEIEIKTKSQKVKEPKKAKS